MNAISVFELNFASTRISEQTAIRLNMNVTSSYKKVKCKFSI